MVANSRRLPTLVNVCDFDALHLREHNANVNTRNYLSSKLPSPMLHRDFRLVVTNHIPSNIVVLPKSLSPAQTSIPQRRRNERRKIYKQPGFEFYRSLSRSLSQCPVSSERDISNDETALLANSFTVDHISPLSNTGLFRTHHLPKIQKNHINFNKNQKLNSKIKTNYEPLPLLHSDHIDYTQSTPPDMFRTTTTPTKQYYEEDNEKINTTAEALLHMPKNQTRKQLHVYMPQIFC